MNGRPQASLLPMQEFTLGPMRPFLQAQLLTILGAIFLLPCTIACAAQLPKAQKGMTTAMAYNVLYNAEDPQASVALIAKAAPDIVCLRELTPKFVTTFKKGLGKTLPYQKFFPKKGTWGAGIASKYPIRNASVFPGKPHRLPAMEGTVMLPSGSLLVLCLHLFPPVGKHKKSDTMLETMDKNAVLRKEQAQYLVKRISGHKGPVLILGDMNEGRDDDAVQTFLKAGFVPACDAPSEDCGATFPGATSLLPAVFEIDHILGRGLSFFAAAVLSGGGSDHYPVAAVFKVLK